MAGKSYAINIGSDSKPLWYGFNTGADYSDIIEDLGGSEIADVTDTVSFGINRPKPPKVRITYYVTGESGATKTVKRFCAPSKLTTVSEALKGGQVDVKGAKKTIKDVSF